MSQIDNHTSVHGDDDNTQDRNDTEPVTADEQTGTRNRGTSKRAPAAGKSSARKRKASATKSNGTRSASATKKARSSTGSSRSASAKAKASGASASGASAAAAEAEAFDAGAGATEELRSDDATQSELRGAPASASAEVVTSDEPEAANTLDVPEAAGGSAGAVVDDVTAADVTADEGEAAASRAGYFEVETAGDAAPADATPADAAPADVAPADIVEPEAVDLDPDYLATLPPPPTDRPARRTRPARPVPPASREPVIDLDEASPPANVTVDPEADDDLPLPVATRAQFWLRRQLHIPSDDPAYLATLPPPPAGAIDLRGTDDDADGDRDAAVGYRRIAAPSLVAEHRDATMSSAATPSASVPDSAEEHHVPDASAPTMATSDPGAGSSGDEPPLDRGSSAGTTTELGDDGGVDSITASSGEASVDTSSPEAIVDLDDVPDRTQSITLPEEDDGVPRWVGRTDDAFAGDEVDTPTRIEPAAPVDDRDDEDDTVVARAPKQSRADRRKEWRKVEQARRYAARRSVRFPILTRSILLWCLIFALAGMAAGGTAALFWSHFNTEIAELREKTDDFEKRSQTAEARIEALRQQAIDDINRGKAELAPALAERGVTQAAEFLSPFVWFVDTLDDNGRASVGTAFAVSSTDNETFLVTSFNTVRSSTVRPSPDINLRKGGDVIKAEFVKWDAERDLALLRIDRGTQPVLDWADDNAQRQQLGGRVYVVNGLGGAGASVNSGVVSDQVAQGFMHDARLGGQSQGAPMITADGKVVGVASMSYRPLNIDTGDLRYAVRIEMACERLLDCSTVARRPRG